MAHGGCQPTGLGDIRPRHRPADHPVTSQDRTQPGQPGRDPDRAGRRLHVPCRPGHSKVRLKGLAISRFVREAQAPPLCRRAGFGGPMGTMTIEPIMRSECIAAMSPKQKTSGDHKQRRLRGEPRSLHIVRQPEPPDGLVSQPPERRGRASRSRHGTVGSNNETLDHLLSVG